MFGKQFDFLKCESKLALKIQHSTNYIKKGNGPSAIRTIFNNQQLDMFEKQKLQELDYELQAQGVQNHEILQNTGKLLQFLYSKKFDVKQTVNAIANHIIWLQDRRNYDLTKNAERVLQMGWVYISGRDFQLRPVISFNIHKINFDEIDFEDFKIAVSRLLLIVQEYMFFPAQIENWIVIAESDDKNTKTFGTNGFQILQAMTKHLQDHFPCCLEKCFIVNVSPGMRVLRPIIEKNMEQITKEKMIYFEYQSDEQKMSQTLQKYIDIEELEIRYGGNREEPIQYWPPNLKERFTLAKKRNIFNDQISHRSKGSFSGFQQQQQSQNYNQSNLPSLYQNSGTPILENGSYNQNYNQFNQNNFIQEPSQQNSNILDYESNQKGGKILQNITQDQTNILHLSREQQQDYQQEDYNFYESNVQFQTQSQKQNSFQIDQNQSLQDIQNNSIIQDEILQNKEMKTMQHKYYEQISKETRFVEDFGERKKLATKEIGACYIF